MDNVEKLRKINRVEMRLLEILGVKVFRKAILRLEKRKHRKDGNRNENYHPKSASTTTLESFSGYLLYNTILHTISLLFVSAYFVITKCTDAGELWTDIIMAVIAIGDFYCLMLQRYIYLKTRLCINRLTEKRERCIGKCIGSINNILKEKNREELKEEYELLRKIIASTETGEDCILTNDCVGVLSRLAAVANDIEVSKAEKASKTMPNETLAQTIAGLQNQSVVGRIEQRVSKLQRLFRVRKRHNVMFNYSIVTESKQCEAAFCRLFPSRTRDGIELTLRVLLVAYQQEGLMED